MDADFILIRNMKKGSDEAFDLFVRKYYAEILKYCGHHCLDASSAEDLAQETFVRFFANLSAYRHMGKAKNFLYTIAGNLCKNQFRRLREAPLEDADLANLADESDADVLAKIEVADALGRLPDELREVVVLHYFQNLKLTEIAGILEIGLPLVKYRMRQAKARLRQHLEQEGSPDV